MNGTTTLDASQAPGFAPSVDVGHAYPMGYDPRISRGQPGSEFAPDRVREQLRKIFKAKNYPPAMIEGILQNLDRESGFDSTSVGDGGTSYGLMQAHNDRWDDLKNFAAGRKKPESDIELQADFIDYELDTKFPELKERLKNAKSAAEAEDLFRRIYERPASVMWTHDSQGNPVFGNDEFRFSADSGRKRGPIGMMSPEDFLALAKDDDFPNERKRKSLTASLEAGEPIEELPSLDVRHKAGEPTGTVADSDGRHRALAAQEAGLPSIPVEMNGAQPGMTELTGQQGKTLPINAPRSGGLMSWLVPSASAQELPPDWTKQVLDAPKGQIPTQEQTPIQPAQTGLPPDWTRQALSTPPQEETLPPPMAEAAMVPGAEAAPSPTLGALPAGMARAAADVPLGIAQLDAELGETLGIPGAQQHAQNMLKAIQAVHGLTGPAMARAPVAGEMGYMAGMMPYALLATKLFGPRAGAQVMQKGFWPAVRNTLVSVSKGGLAGGVSGALAPEDVSGDDYWQRKMDRAIPDIAFGTGMGGVFSALGEMAAPLYQRFAERREQRQMLEQLPAVRDRVVEPLRDVLMTRTQVARSNITALMQQFIESPTGQEAIKDELKRAEHDVLGHGKTFNENEFGVVKPPKKPKTPGAPPAPPSKWIIDPRIAGRTDERAPALRFLDAIRQKYDEKIDQLLAKPSEDPDPVRNLAILRNSRRQFTDEMERQFPGYGAFLSMTDAYRLVSRTLHNEGIGGIRTLFQSGSSLARAIGNLGYGSHMHVMANAMQSIVAELRRPGITANQLQQVTAARGQLPGMPPIRAEQSANALRRLGQSMGTGAALMGPQVVPGL